VRKSINESTFIRRT